MITSLMESVRAPYHPPNNTILCALFIYFENRRMRTPGRTKTWNITIAMHDGPTRSASIDIAIAAAPIVIETKTARSVTGTVIEIGKYKNRISY